MLLHLLGPTRILKIQSGVLDDKIGVVKILISYFRCWNDLLHSAPKTGKTLPNIIMPNMHSRQVAVDGMKEDSKKSLIHCVKGRQLVLVAAVSDSNVLEESSNESMRTKVQEELSTQQKISLMTKVRIYLVRMNFLRV